jgi:hypothetical protein
MEPGEALSTAAQIAVALAGFAGVVVAFRRESVHEWSTLDKFRLRLLLANSILPLGLCTIALVFLTIEPALTGIWRWCSCIAFVVFVPFAITTMIAFRRFALQRSQGAPANFIFFLFTTLGTAATLLQLYNAVLLGAFWPFFTGIVLQLIAAMVQFARMIVSRHELRR